MEPEQTGFGNEPFVAWDQLIDLKFLKRLLNSFSLATGLGASLVDKQGRVVVGPEPYECSLCELIRSVPEGARRCMDSTGKAGLLAARLGEPYIFRCHAGLIEWSAPILIDRDYLGSIACGQVLMWENDEVAGDEIVTRIKDLLPVDSSRVTEAVRQVKVVSGANVQSAADLIFVIANHVARTGMVTLMQRRELSTQQARLAEAIHQQKRMEEALAGLKGSLPIYPLEKEKELLGRVKLGDRTGAKEILNELLGGILFNSAGKDEVLKARLLELSAILSRAAVEAGASLEKLLGLNYDYVQELASLESTEDICAWIVKVLDAFINVVYETRESRNLPVIREAVDYIRAHYSDDLSLEDVAGRVHLSPFYLSRLFKEELGNTFVEFLTRVRIEEAKRLLLGSTLAVQEVADAVGYQDASYFAKVFKRQEGRTPSQFRR